MVLKPSEKTPLSAIYLADLLLRGRTAATPMLQVVTGDPREIADELITNEHVDLVTFTGGVAVGKYIAVEGRATAASSSSWAATIRIIVMEDADIDEASTLAAQGSYKNSGQRCTAVKRMLVHEAVAEALRRPARRRRRAPGRYGDPMDRQVDMGTVIDEAAAKLFEARVNEAVAQGAKLLVGNERQGALYSPTVIDAWIRR